MKAMTKMINNARSITDKIRSVALDIVSSISNDGKTVNTETFNNSELRELKIMLPYGISSSALDKMLVQVIINDNRNNTVVGVYDNSRPSTEPGEVILYSKFDCYIKLLKDGSIEIKSKDGHSILMNSETMTVTSKTDLEFNVDGDITFNCDKINYNERE